MSTGDQAKYLALGSELKRLRENQGIATQAALGRLIGVAQQTVARWEAGGSRPRADQIAVVAKALRADAQQLLVLAGHAKDTAAVVVSFDKPLPLEALSPEAFERFCRELVAAIYPGGNAHAAGKTGHKQQGTDVVLRLPDGKWLSFQCKREAQFGPAKVREAVDAHKVRATAKYILLARIASPQARAEIRKHRGWDIWDQEDLSQRLRALPPIKQRQLVDTYFPGLRFPILGMTSPGPWLTPSAFFASFVVPDAGRHFSHHWELVGREKECAELASALDHPSNVVVALDGPAGGGKSRVLRAVVDAHQKRNPEKLLLLLSPTEPPTVQSLEELGDGRKLLVVDDAHDRSDLELLVRYAASPQSNAQLLLVYRSYAQAFIDRELGRYGLLSARTKLDKPTKADAAALAAQVLKALNGPAWAAEHVATVAFDSPLSVVVGAWIVAKEGLNPHLFGSHATFQQTVIAKYKEGIEKAVATNSKDQELIKGLLRVLALVQPVSIDDPKLFALYEKVENIAAPDATRLTKLLVNAGVLFKRGGRYRLSPDTLADSIIESDCVTQSGTSNGQAERAFNEAGEEHKANLLLNLGRLDWRRNRGDTSQSPLLAALWEFLKSGRGTAQSNIRAAAEVAYFQPQQALDFARRYYDELREPNEEVCRLLQHAAYNLQFVGAACEFLWEIAGDEERQKNRDPGDAIRILKEMAKPEPRKPSTYVESVANYMLSLVDSADVWERRATPFAVLEGALATEGHFTRANRRTLTLSTYSIDIHDVRVVRSRVVDCILQSLASDNLRRAFGAATLLREATHGPLGLMNHQPTEAEVESWSCEILGTLKRVRACVEQNDLAPAVLLRVAESIHWHSQYGDEEARPIALDIATSLNRDLSTRVTRALADGWGNRTSWDDDDLMNRQERRLSALASELVDSFSEDDNALLASIEQNLRQLRACDEELLASSHLFIGHLMNHSLKFARNVIQASLQSTDTPLKSYAGSALAKLMLQSNEEAEALVQELLEQGDEHLPTVAEAYSMALNGRQFELGSFGRTVLQRIFESRDERVFKSTPWLFRNAADHDRRFALGLLLSASSELIASTHRDLFMWFSQGQVDPGSLSDAELRRAVNLLRPINSLDDHWVQEFLRYVSTRLPRLVVELLQGRIEDGTGRRDWRFDPTGGLELHSPLPILQHRDGQTLLQEFLDWSLSRLDEDPLMAHLSGCVDAAFGLERRLCTEVLENWCAAGTEGHFTILGRIAQGAPPSFVFSQRQFIVSMMRFARSLGVTAAKKLQSSLYCSATSGLRSGVPGEPFPQDLELKSKAEGLLAEMSRSEPARPLYEALLKCASRRIEDSIAEGRAMDEEEDES